MSSRIRLIAAQDIEKAFLCYELTGDLLNDVHF